MLVSPQALTGVKDVASGERLSQWSDEQLSSLWPLVRRFKRPILPVTPAEIHRGGKTMACHLTAAG